MVLRFGKTVDWTSRNTAIGRISLDDENLYKLCMFSWLWFLLFFSKMYFHTQCSWGLKIHYKPSTLTEVYCEPTVVQGKVTNGLDHNSPKFCSAGL